MAVKRGFWDGLAAGIALAVLIGLLFANLYITDHRERFPDWIVVQNTLEEPVDLACWRGAPDNVLWDVQVPIMGTVRLEFKESSTHAGPDFPHNVGLTMTGQRTGKTSTAPVLVPETAIADRPYRVILMEDRILLTTACSQTQHVREIGDMRPR